MQVVPTSLPPIPAICAERKSLVTILPPRDNGDSTQHWQGWYCDGFYATKTQCNREYVDKRFETCARDFAATNAIGVRHEIFKSFCGLVLDFERRLHRLWSRVDARPQGGKLSCCWIGPYRLRSFARHKATFPCTMASGRGPKGSLGGSRDFP